MEKRNERVDNRITTWHVINIKAHSNQTPSHYVNAFESIETQDPLIEMEKRANRFVSIRSVSRSNIQTIEGCPQWMAINLVAYTMIDPNAFYNRRSKEDVEMPWDDDVVANKKEAQLIFIPSVHKIAVKRNSDITLNYILQYLKGALESVEPEGFDVDTVKDRDTLERILTAEKLISLNAHISFSNPGRGEMFKKLLDKKLREMNPSSVDIALQGSEERPLNRDNDGLVQAIVDISEENGSVQATIQNGSRIGRERIDTEDHPLVLQVCQIINDVCSTIYNVLNTRFNNR